MILLLHIADRLCYLNGLMLDFDLSIQQIVCPELISFLTKVFETRRTAMLAGKVRFAQQNAIRMYLYKPKLLYIYTYAVCTL